MERNIKPIPEFSPRNNIWKYNTGKNYSTKDATAFEHPAIFPEALAKDHILTWSDEGDLVLDPFMGSGTTAVCCIETIVTILVMRLMRHIMMSAIVGFVNIL